LECVRTIVDLRTQIHLIAVRHSDNDLYGCKRVASDGYVDLTNVASVYPG